MNCPPLQSHTSGRHDPCVIADDFTGASDIANTLVKQGMSTALVTDHQRVRQSETDACVVALKTRSILRDLAVSQSLEAFHWLQAKGCKQFVFKYCSTFDSTQHGKIGPVSEALAKALNTKAVICCPAFPTAARRVFQGHLFVNDKLLSESGMQNHSLNPMMDSDIRRVLAKQSSSPDGHLRQEIVKTGAAAIVAALATTTQILVIADAIDESDLMELGLAADGAPLVTGGSGIALGLPRNFRSAQLLQYLKPCFPPVNGPGVILAGCCATTTLQQIKYYAKSAPVFEINVHDVMVGVKVVPKIVGFAQHNIDHAPLIFSSLDAQQIEIVQATYGSDTLAAALDRLFGQLAVQLVELGFSRLVVAGGETSGAVVKALNVSSFDAGEEIATGVPYLKAIGFRNLAMAL